MCTDAKEISTDWFLCNTRLLAIKKLIRMLIAPQNGIPKDSKE